ncbi:MAG: glycoside hydrolase family 2 TIM barrel-domain containing protein [Clostridia bacterium]
MRGIDFNNDWKFRLANEYEPSKTEESPFEHWQPWYEKADIYTEIVKFTEDDSDWKTVRLPHDWSVEFPFDPIKGEGCTGYLLGGTGWYRKHFVTTEDMVGKKVFVNFDGIYNRSNIYCNGKFMTFHPFGYSPCLVDISDNLKPLGEENVINVKVDHTRYADSRWYTGSGIYRKVSMYILPQINIPVWGLYFTTPFITKEKAVVDGEITIINNEAVDARVFADISISDKDGNVVENRKLERFLLAGQKEVLKGQFEIANPIFWDIDDPHQYTVSVKLAVDGKEIQEEKLKIGIRTSEFDTEEGFFLNGRHLNIYGCCLHHDGGLVGAAVPDDVWRRRLLTLKECGCNAIRTAHNPYSEDFLDLCDEMGLLVQAEFYDEWDYAKDKRHNCFDRVQDYITRGHAEFFQDYAVADIEAVMMRDRNHPSIFEWSLGNEIEWVYPREQALSGYFEMEGGGDWLDDQPPFSKEKIMEMIKAVPEDQYDIGKTANKLADAVRKLDTSRHVVSNCVIPASSYHTGYTDALDIVGFSHRYAQYDYYHENYATKPMQGSEAGTQWFQHYMVQQRPFISGLFVWTGISYMGEAHKKATKHRGSEGSFIDFAGYKREGFHVAKSWWQDKPVVFASTCIADLSLFKKGEDGTPVEKVEGSIWHKKAYQQRGGKLRECWNYADGDEILIEAYTNCDEATLYINGKAEATRLVEDWVDKAPRWIVPFVAGEIKVIAKKDGEEYVHIIKTAGEFAKIDISCDKDTITTDYDCVSHVHVVLQDANGVRLPKDDKEVKFILDGAYINMGVDNGSAKSMQTYQADTLVTSKGRAMMILQGKEKGKITVKAQVGDVVSDTIEITVV